MSRTDKDKRFKYRTDEEVPKGFKYYGTRRKSNRANLTKGFEDGPGGKNCACCGVRMEYKHQMRASGKTEALAGLLEWQFEQGLSNE